MKIAYDIRRSLPWNGNCAQNISNFDESENGQAVGRYFDYQRHRGQLIILILSAL